MTDLTEVFHSIYDLKDEHIENEPIRVACYKALVYVEQLMEATGLEIPNRHDGDGRPHRNVMLTDEYLKARGAVAGTEPAEDVVRRIREGRSDDEKDWGDRADLFVLDVPERFALDHPDEEHRVDFMGTLPPGTFVAAFHEALDDETWTLIDDSISRAATRLGYDGPVDDPNAAW